MLYFRNFETGQPVGRCEILADPAALCFGDTDAMCADTLSRADLLALLMRGYCSIVTPRPQGNIHVSQSVHFFDKAHFGDVLEVDLACTGKTEKNGRMWLGFGASVHRGGTRLMEADMTFIWAA